MKKYLHLLAATMVLILPLASCDKDNNGNDEPEYVAEGPRNYQQFKNWYETLKNTSWKLESSKRYWNSGKIDDNTIPPSSADSYDRALYTKHLATIMTLSSTFTSEKCLDYELYKSTIPGRGSWWINEDGELAILDSFYNGNPGNISGSEYGLLTRFFPSIGKIEECTSDRLVLINRYDSSYDKYVFKRVYGYTPGNNNGGNNNGNSSGYETPEIGLEDYTCTTSSITVKYRIYNQSEAQVTSAKGYYGTSSPTKSVSATVSGSLITMRFTSLSKGTTYYIKCTATGKGGSTTSETVKLMTNY